MDISLECLTTLRLFDIKREDLWKYVDTRRTFLWEKASKCLLNMEDAATDGQFLARFDEWPSCKVLAINNLWLQKINTCQDILRQLSNRQSKKRRLQLFPVLPEMKWRDIRKWGRMELLIVFDGSCCFHFYLLLKAHQGHFNWDATAVCSMLWNCQFPSQQGTKGSWVSSIFPHISRHNAISTSPGFILATLWQCCVA